MFEAIAAAIDSCLGWIDTTHEPLSEENCGGACGQQEGGVSSLVRLSSDCTTSVLRHSDIYHDGILRRNLRSRIPGSVGQTAGLDEIIVASRLSSAGRAAHS